jgi:hypothetical protein
MSVNELLLKIHVITGWVIPPDEIMLLLIDQFKKKILESYSSINVDEFEYAFRNNFVKDWGKNLNLSLIDEVLQNYMSSRSSVSQIEETVTVALPVPKLSNDDIASWLYETKKDWKAGKLKREFVPILFYDYLLENKMVEFDKKEVWDRAKFVRLQLMRDELLFKKQRDTKDNIEFIRNSVKSRNHPEYSRLVVECKRIIIIDYLNQ